MRLILRLLMACSFIFLLAAIVLTSETNQTNLLTDVSWPNCSVKPPKHASAGIVGVTGGLSYHPNPCLNQESRWFSFEGLYVNTGYPGSAYAFKYGSSPRRCAHRNSLCLAYDYGYNDGLYAIKYADLQDAHSTSWWLDVETENSWSADQSLNRASIQGTLAALKVNLPFSSLGIYSSAYQWAMLTGPWHNHLPSWIATGAVSSAAARQACRLTSFTGGHNLLSQYTKSLDSDVRCATNHNLFLP